MTTSNSFLSNTSGNAERQSNGRSLAFGLSIRLLPSRIVWVELGQPMLPAALS